MEVRSYFSPLLCQIASLLTSLPSDIILGITTCVSTWSWCIYFVLTHILYSAVSDWLSYCSCIGMTSSMHLIGSWHKILLHQHHHHWAHVGFSRNVRTLLMQLLLTDTDLSSAVVRSEENLCFWHILLVIQDLLSILDRSGVIRDLTFWSSFRSWTLHFPHVKLGLI